MKKLKFGEGRDALCKVVSKVTSKASDGSSKFLDVSVKVHR